MGKSRRKLRKIADPFVAATPDGTRIRTSVPLTTAEHDVVQAVGSHLGSLAGGDLAARCALGVPDGKQMLRPDQVKHEHRTERKRLLTPQCSSRWAGSITRVSDDMWERQMLNRLDERVSKKRAVAAIERRLGLPARAGGYASVNERWQKRKRLDVLRARVAALDAEIASGNVNVVRGGRNQLNNRNNLDAAGLTDHAWREQWEASRMFLTADGDRNYRFGNGLIELSTDGVLTITLPAPLKHLANAPRGRFEIDAKVAFSYNADLWAAQALTGSVRYDMIYDTDRRRWYLDASWKTPTNPPPSLCELRQHSTLAVDLNAEHLCGWVIDCDGNPTGPPITVAYDSTTTTGRTNAAVRHAIITLLKTARAAGCWSITAENLNFEDARATGRETMGRGKRGKTFRRTVAGIPTAVFRDYLVSMAANFGIAVIAVDPAYTSQWGRDWLRYLQQSRHMTITSHHAAAVVIGRRAMGHSARCAYNAENGTTRPRQSTGRQVNVRNDKRPGQDLHETHISPPNIPQRDTPRKRREASLSAPAPSREDRTPQPKTGTGHTPCVSETQPRRTIRNRSQRAATVQDARPAETTNYLLPNK